MSHTKMEFTFLNLLLMEGNEVSFRFHHNYIHCSVEPNCFMKYRTTKTFWMKARLRYLLVPKLNVK